jgi:hypothetical protein
MAEFTVKDRQTGEILCHGTQKECADFLGCDLRYVRDLAAVQPEYKTETKYSKYRVERHGEVKRGGARMKDVICCDCGVLMENVGATRRRCPECVRRFNLERKRLQMREARNANLVLPNIANKNKTGCEGCIYYSADYEVNKCCNYIFIKGKRRPCPPGNECTVKIERKGYREKEK